MLLYTLLCCSELSRSPTPYAAPALPLRSPHHRSPPGHPHKMLSYVLPPRSPLLISPLPPPPTVTPAFYLQHSTQPRPVPDARRGVHEPPAGAGQAEPRGRGSPESPSRALWGGGEDREMRTGVGLGGGGTTAPSCMRTARGTAFNCPRSASSTKGSGAPGSLRPHSGTLALLCT